MWRSSPFTINTLIQLDMDGLVVTTNLNHKVSSNIISFVKFITYLNTVSLVLVYLFS